MKVVVVFVITLFFGNNGSANEVVKTTTDYESYTDILRKDLLASSWIEEEKPCLNEILKIIDNVKNTTLWATWIWDSIQLPVGQLYGSIEHFGNYDQCLSETVGDSLLPFRTQYCRANITWRSPKDNEIYSNKIDPYSSVDEYIKTRTYLNLRFNELSWGICAPEICQRKSLKTFVSALIKQSHLSKLQTAMEVTINNCEPAGEVNKHVDGHYYLVEMFLTFKMQLAFLTTTVCFTIFDSKITALIIVGVVLTSTMCLSQQNAEDSSYITKILKCFCIKRNIKDFLEENKNDIKCLHGIRFISCSLIVLTHVFTTVFALSAAYGLDHEELFNSYGSYVSEFVIVVDTFFVLSGLLMIRNNNRKRSIRDVAEFIIKRYFRLIWWYTAIMLIIVFVLPRFGCGPMCDKYIQREGGACIKTWWLGLLMIGNYVELAQICYPITWYVYCDFHMSVIGIILLWIYQRSRRIAITCFIILTVLSALLPAIAIYDMPELMKFKIDFETFNTIRNSDYLSVIAMYSQTHNRAIPYVMGIMLGYIMSNYKEIPFGRIITKNSYVFLAVIVTGILSYPFISLSDNLKAALVLLIVRFGWALLICALIALCEYGKLPSIKGFLSWSMFAPLSKLTYGIYFIHFLILTTNMVSVRGRLHYNAYILAERFFGQLTMSAFISLFFLLFIEAPLNNLVQLFLKSVGKTETKVNVQSNEDNNENKTNELTTEASQTEEKEKLQ